MPKLARRFPASMSSSKESIDTESRLRHESEPVAELHVTPGNPRNLRLGVSYAF